MVWPGKKTVFLSLAASQSYFALFAYAAPANTLKTRQEDHQIGNDIGLDIDLLNPTRIENSQAPTFLNDSYIVEHRFQEMAHFAQASYCVHDSDNPDTLQCGVNCSLGDAEYLTSLGNSGLIPDALVAWSDEMNSIIISHEGTNSDNFLSVINDLDINLVDVDERFGDIPGQIHSGFQNTFFRTLDAIAGQVNTTLETHPNASIRVTGHSLGGAIALVEGLYMTNNYPNNTVLVYAFAAPRIGNEEFARAYSDILGSNQYHINHNADLVPHIPPYSWDYSQVDNEIWLPSNGSVMLCPGIENHECSNSLDRFTWDDHAGPFFGLNLTRTTCPNYVEADTSSGSVLSTSYLGPMIFSVFLACFYLL